jgi:hypothetical protein
MNTRLINYTNPKSLPDGAKLFSGTATTNESSQRLHDSEPKSLFTIEEIQLRVETVTPLLREIRDYRPPDHWGIND